ncbi:MAG: alpha-amylase [Lachnospiraceae bacterium]
MADNGTILQYFEWYLEDNASLWRCVKEEAVKLAQSGITAVWLPPAYKGAGGIHDVGYGVYDVYDLGEFDQKGSVPTKYGTKTEYLEAIQALHHAHIQVYADIVLNHKMGADETEEIKVEAVNQDNRAQETSGTQTITAWTKYTFPGRNGKYSDFKWNATHFSGVDWDERNKKSQIYLMSGKEWNRDVDTEHANYDYLMGTDLDFDNKEVLAELERWGEWYLKTTGVDGVRLDAVKHIDSDFYKDWLPKMRTALQKELFAVGEYWKPEKYTLEEYLSDVIGNMSLFDVPLHFNFYHASQEKERYDLRRIFDGSLVAENPVKAVTFVDNHDTQPGQALQSFVESWFKPLAYALVLLRTTGYPCVFYGDYYGIVHDKVAALSILPSLIQVRRTCIYGQQHDYFEDAHAIGWTYEGDEEHAMSGAAILMSNCGVQTKRMYLGKKHANCEFYNICGAPEDISLVDADGYLTCMVREMSVAVYISGSKKDRIF